MKCDNQSHLMDLFLHIAFFDSCINQLDALKTTQDFSFFVNSVMLGTLCVIKLNLSFALGKCSHPFINGSI